MFTFIHKWIKKINLTESYINHNGKSITDEQKHTLFEAIRFPYLAYSELQKVVKEKIAPEDLLAEGLLYRLGMSLFEN